MPFWAESEVVSQPDPTCGEKRGRKNLPVDLERGCFFPYGDGAGARRIPSIMEV